ncbi:MAG: right-handed parallel beta-helix repeat-containing protein, partial [Phycisphaerales bacterium]
ISNCTFKGNFGEAIDNHRGELTITGCTFESNWGRAVSHRGDDLTATNCIFNDNWGIWGVGIDCHAHSSEVMLRDCTFTGNFAIGHAAALDCHAEKLTLYNCRFTGNVAHRTSCVDSWVHGEVIAENCTFTGNTGNAIDHTVGRLFVSNCLLAGNRGQAIETHGRYVTIRNCTFSDNQTDKDGSALDVRRQTRVSNSIFWANSPPVIKIWPRWAEIKMDYCNIEGGWPGVGNIEVDPGFIAPGYWELNGTPDDPNDDYWVDGDYRLPSQAGRWDPIGKSWVQDDATSPCIDAGDPNGPIGREPFPNGGRANMGAYGAGATASKTYFGGPLCDVILAGDINGDGVVDFDDLAILMSQWMMRGEDFVNKPPVVTLIEPQDGAQITWPGPTTFRAEAHDPDGEVERVTFNIQHKTETGTRTRGFGGHEGVDGWEDEFNWQSSHELPAGNWTAWAEATDNEGAVSVSPSIVITLLRP